MPYPNNYGMALALMALGFTPITITVGGLLAAPTALLAWKHWQQVKDEPGHFDVLDGECIDLLHLNPETAAETIEHLNAWPAEQKERFRQVAVRQVERGWPFELLLERIRGKRHELREVAEADDGRVYSMMFRQPRDVVAAAEEQR